MEIKNFGIHEILRYVITGLWICLVFALLGDVPVEWLGTKGHTFLIFLAIISIGAITYFVFRTIILPLLTYLIDVRVHGDLRFQTGRVLIEERFNVEGWFERSDLWQIHIKRQKDIGNGYLWRSSFHMLLITGMVSIIGSLVYSETICNNIFRTWILFSGAVQFFSGLLSFVLYEIRLRNLVVSNSFPELEGLINTFLWHDSIRRGGGNEAAS